MFGLKKTNVAIQASLARITMAAEAVADTARAVAKPVGSDGGEATMAEILASVHSIVDKDGGEDRDHAVRRDSDEIIKTVAGIDVNHLCAFLGLVRSGNIPIKFIGTLEVLTWLLPCLSG